MKKIIVTLLISASLGLSACQDTFLQMPDTTGTVDLNEVYGSAKNAKSALMTCYREALIHGLPGGWGVGHGTLGAISGEISRGYSWHGTYTISQSGLDVNGTDGSDAGSDHFGNNWAYIRHCFTVRENIDRVPDMSDQEKNYVKAEATALVAYRYMGMFYRYGGLPIVRGSFSNPAVGFRRPGIAPRDAGVYSRTMPAGLRRASRRRLGCCRPGADDARRRAGHQGPYAAVRSPAAFQLGDSLPERRT